MREKQDEGEETRGVGDVVVWVGGLRLIFFA